MPYRYTHPSLTSPHGFFTAQGGVSEGMYASLNCGPGSDDAAEAVEENRRRVASEMGFDAPQLCTLSQVHSADCLVIDSPIARHEVPQADAMATNQPNLLLGILTADCAPILFEDKTAGVIGAAHAGWKGAHGGVMENTVRAMESLGAERSRIKAVIGPCIQAVSYEVTEEFLQPFLAQDSENMQFFTRHCEEAKPTRQPKRSADPLCESHEEYAEGDCRASLAMTSSFSFDLPAYILHRAAQIGLQQIENLAIDTYPATNHCFSNRRRTHNSEPDYGRQISVIGLRN